MLGSGETESGGARGQAEGMVMAAAVAQEPMLLCHVRARPCALPVRHVVETLRPLPIESLQGMPPFVLGIAAIRAQPVPVVDPGVLLACAEPARPARFVVLRTGARRIAFAVEGVLGVRALARDAIGELPPLLRDASAELVSALAGLDAEFMLVLSASRLLTDAIWAGVDQGAA